MSILGGLFKRIGKILSGIIVDDAPRKLRYPPPKRVKKPPAPTPTASQRRASRASRAARKANRERLNQSIREIREQREQRNRERSQKAQETKKRKRFQTIERLGYKWKEYPSPDAMRDDLENINPYALCMMRAWVERSSKYSQGQWVTLGGKHEAKLLLKGEIGTRGEEYNVDETTPYIEGYIEITAAKLRCSPSDFTRLQLLVKIQDGVFR